LDHRLAASEYKKVDIFCVTLWRGYFVSRFRATVSNGSVSQLKLDGANGYDKTGSIQKEQP